MEINKLYDRKLTSLTPEDNKLIEKELRLKSKLKKNKFNILIGDNLTTQRLFILYLHYYYDKLKKNKKYHIAIDFEFNSRVIALMQINFGKVIWIIDPKTLKKDDINVFIEKIMLNKRIYKILHGGESLDIPYIYEELLENDKKKIIKFMHRYVDTKFLCEYVRKSRQDEGKCSIYDVLLYFNVIDNKKYLSLKEVSNKVYDDVKDKWDVYNMDSIKTEYAYYDVYYLMNLLLKIYNEIIEKDTPYLTSYYYIIELIRLVILGRRNVVKIISNMKEEVDAMNNYFIIRGNDDSIVKLLDIYEGIMERFVVYENNEMIDYNFLSSINYVKTKFTILLKYIVYNNIANKYTVYKTKKDVYNNELNIKKVYDVLKQHEFKRIVNLLKIYDGRVIAKIKNFI